MTGPSRPVPAPRPALVRTPDQLQQAKRDGAPAPSTRPMADRQGGADRPLAGVLLQLQSERAHG